MFKTEDVVKIIEAALFEDLRGIGDITTEAVIDEGLTASGEILIKEPGVLAGVDFARLVFEMIDPEIEFRRMKCDGATVAAGEVVAVVGGRARSILTAERLSLNLMQRLSGIATLTRKFVELAGDVEGSRARIVDTRKTTPNLRVLEKYAVKVGGGFNHRFGLFDGVLIKDNHIAVVGSVGEAVRRARANSPHILRIEVETRDLDEVGEAIEAGADLVLLDNMEVEQMRRAVEIVGGRGLTEASGGVNLETVRAIAGTGVDYISVGKMTHSAGALDISLGVTS